MAGAPCPPFVRPGGLVGRSVALPRSVPSAFPGQATKRVSLASFWSWRAWPPYRSGLCSPAFSGRGPCSLLARWRGFACSPRFLWEPAAGAGGRAVLRPLSRAPRSRRGEGGPSPLPRGAGGRRPRGLRARGGGGGGGGRAAASLLPLWGAAFGSLPCPPSRRRRIPPRRARSVGVAGPPRAPGAACLAGGGGGLRGGPWTAPPGAPPDLNPPSALPEWAMVMGASWGARPPYCSGAPPRAAPGLGLRAAPALWCGLARLPRPPREQAAGGAGARGVQVQLRPPPPRVAVPSGGGGAFPRLRGGGGPALLRPSSRGGERRGGGVGRAALPPPAPPPRLALACHPLSPARPPRGILVPWGVPGGHGLRRGPVGRQWVSAAGGGGGGGGDPLTLVRASAFPRMASEGAALFAPSWAPPVRCRSAAGKVGACGRFTGGACRGHGAPPPRVQRPLRGGCGAAVSSACLRALLGLKGRGGGEGGGLWSPGAPPDGRGGSSWRFRPRGPAVGWGVALFPPPLSTLREPDPCAGPRWGPLAPAVAARRWPAGSGHEGQRSAVSGLRGSGFPPALVVSALPPTGGGARSSVTPYLRGGVGRGAWLSLGGVPRHCPPPTLSRPPSVPSPAPPLAWGRGLWRWRVSPAATPLGEGIAQGPGEPVVGVRICDAEHRPPFQEGRPRGLPVGPRRPDH